MQQQQSPWKSQRVESKRQQNGDGSQKSSISESPFRPAKSAQQASLSSVELPISLISSPSRGLDTSDSTRDLTHEATQTKYRRHISDRLKSHHDKFGPLLQYENDTLFPLLLPGTISPSSPSKWSAVGVQGKVLESLQEVMLLVRRLREGCVAAARRDSFAVDVYTLSTFLSILIGDDVQFGSSLPQLVDLAKENLTSANSDVAMDMQTIIGESSTEDTLAMLQVDHLAGLYLVWLSVTGGQVARIGGGQDFSKGPGGTWLREREKIEQGLSEEEQNCRWIKAAEEVQAALVDNNAVQLRAVLVQHRISIWQRAIVRKGIARIQGVVWSTLLKAYLHAPLDGRLIDEGGSGDDWLERMLLIDIQLIPPPRAALSATKISRLTTDVPDAWDDSVNELAASLEATSLQQDAAIIHLRASRLAAVFDAFHLPQVTSPDISYEGPLQKWMGRRILQAGVPHLKLR